MVVPDDVCRPRDGVDIGWVVGNDGKDSVERHDVSIRLFWFVTRYSTLGLRRCALWRLACGCGLWTFDVGLTYDSAYVFVASCHHQDVPRPKSFIRIGTQCDFIAAL